MLTVLILAVAILGFEGLAFQTVAVGTTSTMTKTIPEVSTETLTSFSSYAVIVSSTYSYTTIAPSTFFGESPVPSWIVCVYGQVCGNVTSTEHLQTSYAVQSSLAFNYSQAITGSVTQISTVSVTTLLPASETLGFTDGSFTTLAIVVIGGLIAAALQLELKTPHNRKQAKLNQFLIEQRQCKNCGVSLPPDSEYCNKCGFRQDDGDHG